MPAYSRGVEDTGEHDGEQEVADAGGQLTAHHGQLRPDART